jgi:hypothetical protein
MLSGNYNIQGLFFKIQWLFALESGYDYLYQRLLVVLYFTHAARHIYGQVHNQAQFDIFCIELQEIWLSTTHQSHSKAAPSELSLGAIHVSGGDYFAPQ